MAKVKIEKARAFVRGRFKTEGSVLANNVQGKGMGFSTRLEIDSEETAEAVAKLVRNAENGCFVMNSLLEPVTVEREFLLNGEPLRLNAKPPR
jgi:organic hydroperoxide reductase OsmC/OhrA